MINAIFFLNLITTIIDELLILKIIKITDKNKWYVMLFMIISGLLLLIFMVVCISNEGLMTIHTVGFVILKVLIVMLYYRPTGHDILDK